MSPRRNDKGPSLTPDQRRRVRAVCRLLGAGDSDARVRAAVLAVDLYADVGDEIRDARSKAERAKLAKFRNDIRRAGGSLNGVHQRWQEVLPGAVAARFGAMPTPDNRQQFDPASYLRELLECLDKLLAANQPMLADRDRFAAETAEKLLEHFDIPTTTYRRGKFCKVTGVLLCDDEDADTYNVCRAFLAERRKVR